jgi:outer membrane protein, heavy metal efflux system
MRRPASSFRYIVNSLLLCALALLGASGCALQRYEPAPLDAVASARAYEARSVDDPALRQYMVAHGYPQTQWPVPRWGLSELTLLAFFFHPELAVARAQAAAARADAAAAAQPPGFGVTPRVEHHSLEPEDAASPWSLGFEVEIPLAGTSRREAIGARYSFLADAAKLDVGSKAWAIRSRVRTRLLDLYAAQRTVSLTEGELNERSRLVALLERRFASGAASRVEMNAARLQQTQLEGDLRAAQLAQQRGRAALAQALGVPLAAMRELPLDFAALEQTPATLREVEAQRAALLNRLDVRASLLDYAAADAAVKLEIARQYPSLSLSPGYLWDQGDNVWSIAATLLLPAGGNRRAIDAAQAHREVAGREFLALQGRVISEAESAQAEYAKALEGVSAAEGALRLHSAREESVRKQFDAGYADRVELILAQLEAAAARRNALSVALETQRALGALEEALQMPLAGAPLPDWNPFDQQPRAVAGR